MDKEFPTQRIDGDTSGRGTARELSAIVMRERPQFVEVRSLNGDDDLLSGSFGQVQRAQDGVTVEMSVLFRSDGAGGGLEADPDVPSTRHWFSPNAQVEWVIHPPIK